MISTEFACAGPDLTKVFCLVAVSDKCCIRRVLYPTSVVSNNFAVSNKCCIQRVLCPTFKYINTRQWEQVRTKKTLLFLFASNMLVIRTAIHYFHVRIVDREKANREEPGHIDSSEAVWSGPILFVYAIMPGN